MIIQNLNMQQLEYCYAFTCFYLLELDDIIYNITEPFVDCSCA